GSSFVGQPPTISGIPGLQTSVTISAANTQLLGDSLSFSVQGSLASGLKGDPAADNACTEAWRPPNPSAITLAASGSPVGQTITPRLQVTATGSTVAAFGSQPPQFVYSIDGHAVGPPTTATRISVPNLAAGASHTPAVSVYPAGHPTAAVQVVGEP